MSFVWFPYSLAATLLIGISLAFYKLPSLKNQSRHALNFWAQFTPFIISFVVFFSYMHLASWPMVIVATAWGASFALIVSMQMYALKHVETNVVFPVTTTSSMVLTVLIGLLFFGDAVRTLQVIGILLIIATVYLFLYRKGKFQHPTEVVYVTIGIVVLGTFNKVLQKVIATTFDIHVFQIFQYFFAAIFALILLRLFEKTNRRAHLFGPGMKQGFIIGVFSFLGGFALLIALATGPISLVNSIHSLYIIATAVVAYLVFKEKLNRQKIVLMICAIAAIALIRLG